MHSRKMRDVTRAVATGSADRGTPQFSWARQQRSGSVRSIDHHTTPEQAGNVFSRVKPKLAVYSHIVPFNASDLVTHTRKTYSGPLEVGEDLMSFEIGDEVKVRHASEIVGGPQSPQSPR